MEDWAEIRRLHAGEGMSVRGIAKHLGVARDTVARAVASEVPPRYVRAPAPSRFDVVEPRVRVLLKEFPSMPASVVAERVGWSGSGSWFRKRVALVRVDYAPRDPADRIDYQPGDQAQCDLWFPPVKVPLGAGQFGSPPVLVIVASFARFITAVMLPSRTTGDLLAGMWSLLANQLGAVPRRLVWDNEAGIGRGNRLAEGVSGFCGTLATRVVQLKPFDPESKGIVERVNEYLETSFLPGRAFTDPGDFNAQLEVWLPLANARLVRRTGHRPDELIVADRARMLALPPVPPVVGFSARVRLARDYYVRVAGNDYSVDPAVISRMVEVRADLTMVTVTCDHRIVAVHARCWATGQILTDVAHVITARRLRHEFASGSPAAAPDPVDELARDLADYDHAFGVALSTDGPMAR